MHFNSKSSYIFFKCMKRKKQRRFFTLSIIFASIAMDLSTVLYDGWITHNTMKSRKGFCLESLHMRFAMPAWNSYGTGSFRYLVNTLRVNEAKGKSCRHEFLFGFSSRHEISCQHERLVISMWTEIVPFSDEVSLQNHISVLTIFHASDLFWHNTACFLTHASLKSSSEQKLK